MRPKPLLLLLGAITFISLTSCELPSIDRFDVIPTLVCDPEATVTLEWSIEGGVGQITTDNMVYEQTAEGTNTARVTVPVPTTFTLSVEYGPDDNRESIRDSVSVIQLTGTRLLDDLNNDRVTCSPEVGWQYTRELMDLEGGPTGARIKRIINRSNYQLKVVNPSGIEDMVPARMSSGPTSPLINEKFVGVWTITALVPDEACTPPGGTDPSSEKQVYLEVEVGCP